MRVGVSAGVTTGPGRGPADYERMQRRHTRASNPMVHMLASAYAWHQPACPNQAHTAHTARAFTKRVEVCGTPPRVTDSAPLLLDAALSL